MGRHAQIMLSAGSSNAFLFTTKKSSGHDDLMGTRSGLLQAELADTLRMTASGNTCKNTRRIC